MCWAPHQLVRAGHGLGSAALGWTYSVVVTCLARYGLVLAGPGANKTSLTTRILLHSNDNSSYTALYCCQNNTLLLDRAQGYTMARIISLFLARTLSYAISRMIYPLLPLILGFNVVGMKYHVTVRALGHTNANVIHSFIDRILGCKTAIMIPF